MELNINLIRKLYDINLVREIFQLLSVGYRIFFHFFFCKCPISISSFNPLTHAIDRQVSSTRSLFHRSFNQKFVEFSSIRPWNIQNSRFFVLQTNFNSTLLRRCPDRKLCIEEKLIDFSREESFGRSGTILEKRKFASELNP